MLKIGTLLHELQGQDIRKIVQGGKAVTDFGSRFYSWICTRTTIQIPGNLGAPCGEPDPFLWISHQNLNRPIKSNGSSSFIKTFSNLNAPLAKASSSPFLCFLSEILEKLVAFLFSTLSYLCRLQFDPMAGKNEGPAIGIDLGMTYSCVGDRQHARGGDHRQRSRQQDDAVQCGLYRHREAHRRHCHEEGRGETDQHSFR